MLDDSYYKDKYVAVIKKHICGNGHMKTNDRAIQTHTPDQN